MGNAPFIAAGSPVSAMSSFSSGLPGTSAWPAPGRKNGAPVSRSLCGLKSFALHGLPDQVAAQVLPETLQPPDHVQLPIGKMLEEAVADEPRYILPVVVALVGNLFLQNGTYGDHCGKRIPEYEEFEEKFPAQHAQPRCQNDSCDPRDLHDRSEQLKQPKIGEGQATDPAIARPEEHIAIRPQNIQQPFLPARSLSSK